MTDMQISYPSLSCSWEVTQLNAGKPRFCAQQVKVFCLSLSLLPIWTADLHGKRLSTCTLPGRRGEVSLCTIILLHIALYAVNTQC